jgi:hypothetical protein
VGARMISRCCGADIYIAGNEYYYYVCSKCNCACNLKEIKMNLGWEPILKGEYNETTRLRVFGGWVLRVKKDTRPPHLGMVFIPDENHEWEIEE